MGGPGCRGLSSSRGLGFLTITEGLVRRSASWPGTLCFRVSHQLRPLPFAEGLSADYVKGENPEAVVCEEPQGEDLQVTVLLKAS